MNLESLGVPAGTSRRLEHPTLGRMEALAALLGSPQLEYPVVHLTGTNGKDVHHPARHRAPRESGLSVGAYTSPHLERVNERITWNDHVIDDETLDELLTLVATIEPHLPEPPSYFEILTGVAYRWFADVAVDAAVIEVGVGGRWDATNVAAGRVAAVTNVSVDHVEYLGRTPLEIANDKAGIVKPGGTLVLGETDPALQAPFLERGAPRVLERGRDFGVTANHVAHGGRLISLFTPEGRYDDVFLSLHGAHQADNAALPSRWSRRSRPPPRRRPRHRGARTDPLTRPARSGRTRPAAPPRRCPQRRRRPRAASRARGGLSRVGPDAGRRPPARERPPRDARGPRRRRRGPRHRLRRAQPPGPRPGDGRGRGRAPRPPTDRVEVVPDVAAAVDRALAVTPRDGQVVVTGSLTPSERPRPGATGVRRAARWSAPG